MRYLTLIFIAGWLATPSWGGNPNVRFSAEASLFSAPACRDFMREKRPDIWRTANHRPETRKLNQLQKGEWSERLVRRAWLRLLVARDRFTYQVLNNLQLQALTMYFAVIAPQQIEQRLQRWLGDHYPVPSDDDLLKYFPTLKTAESLWWDLTDHRLQDLPLGSLTALTDLIHHRLIISTFRHKLSWHLDALVPPPLNLKKASDTDFERARANAVRETLLDASLFPFGHPKFSPSDLQRPDHFNRIDFLIKLNEISKTEPALPGYFNDDIFTDFAYVQFLAYWQSPPETILLQYYQALAEFNKTNSGIGRK